MPFFLLSEAEQKSQIEKLQQAGFYLQKKMDVLLKNDTKTSQAVNHLLLALNQDQLDEYNLAQALESIYEVICNTNLFSHERDFAEFKKYSDIFRQRAFHHKIRSEKINKKCKLLSPEDRLAYDQKILKEKLIFYVVEYTLQVGKEFKHIDQEQKMMFLDEGLKVESGNLPGLRTFMQSYQEEAVYSVCEENERNQLLKIFLELQEILNGDNLDDITNALDEFNLKLLKIALKYDITHFSGLILKPYPDDTLIQDIIKELS